MSQTTAAMPAGWGELWSRVFEVYRARFLTLIGISAVVFIPVTLLQTLNQAVNISGATGMSLVVQCFALIAMIAILPLGYGALGRVVCDGCLKLSGGFASTFRQAFQLWPRYLPVVLLLYLLALLGVIWAIVPCVGWLTGPGLVALFGMMMFFTPFIILMERKGAIDTLRRSWDLVRRQFWRIVGAFAAISAAGGVVTMVLYGISAALTRPLAPDLDPSAMLSLQSVVVSLVSLPLTLLLTPLMMTLAGVLYFDLRTQTEGFDAAAFTAGAVGGERQLSDLAGEAPAAQSGNLITMQEVGNLVVLSIVVMVGFAFVYVVILASNPEILEMFR